MRTFLRNVRKRNSILQYIYTTILIHGSFSSSRRPLHESDTSYPNPNDRILYCVVLCTHLAATKVGIPQKLIVTNCWCIEGRASPFMLSVVFVLLLHARISRTRVCASVYWVCVIWWRVRCAKRSTENAAPIKSIVCVCVCGKGSIPAPDGSDKGPDAAGRRA